MRTILIGLALALSACGVSNGTSIADLSDAQATAICEEYEERVITCEGEGFEFELTYGGDCEDASVGDAPEGCEATVGDYRDCFDAVYAQSDEELCSSDGLPSDCDALFTEACIGAE
jgi:hypothetical protein